MDNNTKQHKISKTKCKTVKKREIIYRELAHRLGVQGHNGLDQINLVKKAIVKIDLYQSLLEQKEEHIRAVLSEYYSAGEANPSLNLKYKKEIEMEQTIVLLKRDQERLFKENLKLKRENSELKNSNKEE